MWRDGLFLKILPSGANSQKNLGYMFHMVPIYNQDGTNEEVYSKANWPFLHKIKA